MATAAPYVRSGAPAETVTVTAEVPVKPVSVTLRAPGEQSIDQLLQAAWDNGAPDAFVVRD